MAKQQSTKDRPNIVLIMADDMGFSDIGCFGSEISTPHLDELASDGIRFSQMYNNARCCPSRASLLTGLYPHQAGVGHMVDNYGVPAYQGYLREDCITIAEALKTAGYRTGLSGKWHVGGAYSIHPADWTPGDPGFPLPTQRGFDRFYGTLAGAGSYFNPHTLMDQDRFIRVNADEDYYYTDAISDKAVHMIDEFQRDGAPFFLYVAYTAPHWPLQAPPEDIAKYEGRYLAGWDRLREERYERLVKQQIIDDQWRISPRDDEAPPWEDVPNQPWEDRRMAVYAAQVERMDQGIGRILNQLRDSGVERNTLVLFLSDNGGCAELLEEDGRLEKKLARNRKGEKIRGGNIPDTMPGSEDTYMSYGLPWSNASNTPFRLYKHWVHEGGISTPCIARWPATMKEKGKIMHQPAHVIDIMATCLDVAGASYPEQFRNQSITPLEGESFSPVLSGNEWCREQPIFWEHEGNAAVRSGTWKLVRKFPGDWELYNIEEDRTELSDQSAANTYKVKEMEALYEEWAQRCGVIPWEQILKERERKA
jgi:arylsulfatase A-like enzyme